MAVYKTLYDGVYSLACGTGTIQHRLGLAYRSIALLQQSDFPEELQESFKSFKEISDQAPEVLSDAEAVAVAKKLLDLLALVGDAER